MRRNPTCPIMALTVPSGVSLCTTSSLVSARNPLPLGIDRESLWIAECGLRSAAVGVTWFARAGKGAYNACMRVLFDYHALFASHRHGAVGFEVQPHHQTGVVRLP